MATTAPVDASGGTTYGTPSEFTVACCMGGGGSPFYPHASVLADINHDGILDYLYANSSSAGPVVDVYLGHGDGTFASSPASYSAYGQPIGLAVGDLTNNGVPDIVVADGGTNGYADYTVLLGNGDGTFRVGGTYTINADVNDVELGDLNGDGRLDLVIASASSEIAVLMGNGDGTFGTPTYYTTHGGAQSTTIADLNGDGHPDVVVAEGNPPGADSATIGVFLNTGNGTLGTRTGYNIGNTYATSLNVAVGDINGDGVPDLAVSDGNCGYDPGHVEILLGTGGGGFNVTASLSDGCTADVALADATGNGHLDVVSVSYGPSGSRVSIYPGNGDGTFGTRVDYPPPNPSDQFRTFVVGDINRDGKPDVIMADGSSIAAVYLNITTGTFTPVGGALTTSETLGGGNPSESCPCQLFSRPAHADPVDTADGNFTEQYNDLTVPGRGQPLSFVRTYNSMAAGTNGSLGYGWTDTYNAQLSQDPNTGKVTVTQENGSQVTFAKTGSGSSAVYAPTAPRFIATLTQNTDGSWVFTRKGTETLRFSSAGLLTSLTDRNGYATTLTYNTSNQLTTVTDPAGRTLTMAYTGSLLASVTDSSSRIVKYGYSDGVGNLTDVTDVNGGNTHFTYDTGHHLLTVRDQRGNTVTTNHYDTSNRVDYQLDGLQRKTTFTYASDGSYTITADPKGNQIKEIFSAGVATAVTRGYGTSQAATWTYAYDPYTLGVIGITDPNGHGTYHTYDSAGNILTTSDGLGRTTTYEYNAFNEPTTITDPKGVATTMSYDTNGNLLATSTPLVGTGQNQTTSYRYQDPNHPGDVTSMTDPDGNVWIYAWDAYGNRTQTMDPLGNRSLAQYDIDGRMTASFTPKGAPPVAQDLQGAGKDAGNGFAVARRNDGTVWAQGNNSYGQIGNGSTASIVSVPTEVCAPGQTAPCTQFLSGVVSVSGGRKHSLAAKSDGTAWAWGNNSSGQLGTGNATQYVVPVQVTGLTGVTVKQVAAGAISSYAIAGDGTVWAWGDNSAGQLGNGTTTNSSTPVHVCAPGVPVPCTSFLNNVKSISSSTYFVIAVKNDGTVWAWGDNGSGAVGNGTTTNATEPAAVCAVGQTAPCSSFLSSVTAVAAGGDDGGGYEFAMALTSAGTVDTWGDDIVGELGAGYNSFAPQTIPAAVSGLSGVASIAAGYGSGYTTMTDGSLRSWGDNYFGELGIGTVTKNSCNCDPSPQRVLNVFQATVVSSGEHSTFAVSIDGSTWSWGEDGSGQLGNGSSSSNFYPTPTKFTGITGSPNAAYETAYTYDGFGSIKTITDPLGHMTKRTYDPDENLSTVQDGNQSGSPCTGSPAPCTQYTYDAANELTTVTRADGTTNITDYNPDGTILDQKDGKGDAIATYGYDPLARVTSLTDALGNATAYGYDGAGNEVSKQDPGGNCSASPTTGCTTMTYDAANEPKTVTYSDGVTPNVTNITYDADGQRTGMTDGTGTSTWAIDSLHRMTSYQNGGGATVSYDFLTPSGGYDLKNQVGHIVYPNSAGTVTQTWDGDGRLASVKDWNGKSTTFTYDVNANLTGQVAGNTTAVTDTFGFNAADQLTSVSDSNGSTLFAASYTRDSAGQLTYDTSQTSAQANYKYTALNQVCYAGSSTSSACSSPPAGSYPYAYDGADNPISVENTSQGGTNTQQFNSADELCWTVSGSSTNACSAPPSQATSFSYDSRGNRTAQVPSSGQATCTAYDEANRLVSITTGSGNTCTSPTTVGTYKYDGSGLRMSKVAGGATTNYTWDENAGLPLLLQATTGTTVTNYIYANGTPIEQVTGTTTYWLHRDQLGSTRLMTDANGASVATFTYDPYGNLVTSTGSATTPFLYAGQYRDSESGFYYMRGRYYDPATSCWLNTDPAVSRTREPYTYAQDNPINHTDPSGLDSSLPPDPACVLGPEATPLGSCSGDPMFAICNLSDSGAMGPCAGYHWNPEAPGTIVFPLVKGNPDVHFLPQGTAQAHVQRPTFSCDLSWVSLRLPPAQAEAIRKSWAAYEQQQQVQYERAEASQQLQESLYEIIEMLSEGIK